MKYLFLIGLMFLTSCADITPPSPNALDEITLTPVAFSDLPGWSSDHITEVIPVLLRSCAVNKKPEWTTVCAELENLSLQDDAAAWAFFENHFQPYAAASTKNNQGLFTGYYEPLLHGSLQKTGDYQTPLYARPADLISVDLGDFKKDLHGQHIVGKVEGSTLKPYDDRAAITTGSLTNRATVLAWVNDPADAFFLAVQGSGRVTFEDKTEMRLGYAGANGLAYVAIGRALADKNLIDKPVTMQKIRSWLKAHPEQDDEMMNLNPSYVFFKKSEGDGPIGAEGVVLTPQRSLAVDPHFVPLGTPLWLGTVDGKGALIQRLVVAQDTGGAIKGAVRGDLFWGAGDEAAMQAGAMQSQGFYYLLLPKTVTPPSDEH